MNTNTPTTTPPRGKPLRLLGHLGVFRGLPGIRFDSGYWLSLPQLDDEQRAALPPVGTRVALQIEVAAP